MTDQELQQLIEIVQAEFNSEPELLSIIVHELVSGVESGSEVQLSDQLFVSFHEPQCSLIKPVRNQPNPWQISQKKPMGGLWTSTYVNGLSDWTRVAEKIGLNHPKKQWWLLKPKACRVLVIDSEAALSQLPTIRGDREWDVGVDWEAVAQEWDAIHVTKTGQASTHTSYPLSLWGWDCECTFWCRWMFDEVLFLK